MNEKYAIIAGTNDIKPEAATKKKVSAKSQILNTVFESPFCCWKAILLCLMFKYSK